MSPQAPKQFACSAKSAGTLTRGAGLLMQGLQLTPRRCSAADLPEAPASRRGFFFVGRKYGSHVAGQRQMPAPRRSELLGCSWHNIQSIRASSDLRGNTATALVDPSLLGCPCRRIRSIRASWDLLRGRSARRQATGRSQPCTADPTCSDALATESGPSEQARIDTTGVPQPVANGAGPRGGSRGYFFFGM